MNVITYRRVSTSEQADSGLGLDAQMTALMTMADHKGWTVVGDYVDAGATGSNLDRPGLQAALLSLRSGDADALAVSKLDRVSRSLVDFAHLINLSRKEEWAFIAIDLNVDTSTPTGELLANVMMSVAQWERRVISQRTSDALQAKKDAGARLGRPVVVSGAVRAAVAAWRALQPPVTWQACATALNDAGVPTAHGGRMWYPSTVRAIHESVVLDGEAVG